MKKYLPLLVVEFYLLTTLVLFFWGPITFRLHNLFLFICLMIPCHLCFVVGYVFGIKMTPNSNNFKCSNNKLCGIFWILFWLGLASVWGSYKNTMLFDGIIPNDFFAKLIQGFSEPGASYSERMMNLADGQKSELRIFNILSLFFSFTKLLFIFHFLYFWGILNAVKKFFAIGYCFIFVSVGISAGVNSIVFIFFIFVATSLLVIMYTRKNIYLNKSLIILSVLFLVPVIRFGKIMSERGGGFEYFASTSPLGDVSISSDFVLGDAAVFIDLLYYSFVWLTYYVCQGYYGLSLILDMDLKWTYGFGNSEFLQRQFLMITGEDISSLTFQSRIDHFWGKSAQWHSFYGQFANDVGFIGLPFLLFLLAFLFASVWKSSMHGGNFFGAALMPIFLIMFIFFPANNQIFGFIDTLSYFIIISFLWLLNLNK
jgi:hypothetical protein